MHYSTKMFNTDFITDEVSVLLCACRHLPVCLSAVCTPQIDLHDAQNLLYFKFILKSNM